MVKFLTKIGRGYNNEKKNNLVARDFYAVFFVFNGIQCTCRCFAIG